MSAITVPLNLSGASGPLNCCPELILFFSSSNRSGVMLIDGWFK